VPDFCRRRGRFDREIGFTTLLVGAFLHRAHTESIWLSGGAIVGVCDGNGGDGSEFAHGLAVATEEEYRLTAVVNRVTVLMRLSHLIDIAADDTPLDLTGRR
jgi:hypothetical protein